MTGNTREIPQSTKQSLLEAKRLIKAKQYEDARAILMTVDHPTAAKWLKRLNEILQTQPVKKVTDYTVIAVLVMVLYAVLWLPGIVANIVFLQQAKREQRETQTKPEGLGCLWSLLIVLGVLPFFITVVGVILLMLTALGVSSGSFIYTLF